MPLRPLDYLRTPLSKVCKSCITSNGILPEKEAPWCPPPGRKSSHLVEINRQNLVAFLLCRSMIGIVRNYAINLPHLPEEEGPAGCQSDAICVPTKNTGKPFFWSLPHAALPDMATAPGCYHFCTLGTTSIDLRFP